MAVKAEKDRKAEKEIRIAETGKTILTSDNINFST
jgi:hypothetical protein